MPSKNSESEKWEVRRKQRNWIKSSDEKWWRALVNKKVSKWTEEDKKKKTVWCIHMSKHVSIIYYTVLHTLHTKCVPICTKQKNYIIIIMAIKYKI